MQNPLINQVIINGRRIGRSIRQAKRKVDQEFKRQISILRHLNNRPGHFRALASAVELLAQTSKALGELSRGKPGIDQVITLLTDQVSKLDETRWGLPEEYPQARAVLARTQADLLEVTSRLQVQSVSLDSLIIIVPIDVLYQAYGELFPAERMLVVSGRRTENKTVLGASFEVTGVNNCGNVRADSDRLGEALIAMEKAGSQLAAWINNHPGRGPEATSQSLIDMHQHADWIVNYSPNLLSAIFVEDGYVRFWGTALENGQVRLDMLGSGLKEVSADENIYQLE